ncbi:unnamed protein product, partial [Amoebophrya sp. A25]|eukprot:GSA25T00014167001.1
MVERFAAMLQGPFEQLSGDGSTCQLESGRQNLALVDDPLMPGSSAPSSSFVEDHQREISSGAAVSSSINVGSDEPFEERPPSPCDVHNFPVIERMMYTQLRPELFPAAGPR